MTYDPDDYVFFWSGPSSQWHKATFTLDGPTFNTAEQAMMYLKAQLFDDQPVAERILATGDPRKQKALGRQVANFDAAIWDQHKVAIVERINMARFTQNKGLRRKLFQTGARTLVEASPLDTIWGIGLDEVNARQTPLDQWPGQNLLGLALTKVRDTLRAEFPDEFDSVATNAA